MLRKTLLMLLVLTTTGPLLASNTLDGALLKVKVTPDAAAHEAGEHAFKSHLAFEAGQMRVEEGEPQGLAPAAYETNETSGRLGFSATQTGPKGSTAVWTGAFAGRRVEGTLIWRKEDGRTFTYTIRGSRKR